MTTKQVADRLIALCRQGKIQEAQDELYGEGIESIEPKQGPLASAKGKKAVIERGKQFASMIQERHGGSFSDPIICGKYFSVSMTLDATFKDGKRNLLEEICVYEVKDGQIIFEQFFW
jgi:hypothetical protein